NASISQGKLVLTSDTGCSFAFGAVNSNALMALGVNTFMQGDSAGTIEVNSFIVDHHTHICAGLVDAQTGEIASGDNSNALNIAELRQTQVSLDLWRYSRGQSPTSQTVSTSLNGFLSSLTGDLGVLVNDYQASEDFNTMIVNQLHDLIGQVSGVNLDEELIDLLKYQRGYQAAARIITVADEMLQTLIQL
ncbi:MAG: flagellar hook-associated protein FlgK, partial [Deltaproteobacteria bacterium]|nr:flagellar hook-associated protein FlgK [Deltaproteobacteria bacterium]